jgi:uncharacterized 2Fe-2S/4Fe-4S cluster protein (DUF4445 family)
MSPLVIQKTLSLPVPSDADRRAYDQRIRDAIGLAPLHIPISLLRRIPEVIGRQREFLCTVGCLTDGYRLIDVGSARSYSVALDLGTTNIVALLYDNVARNDVLTRTLENPQIAFGSDILTRMHHAMSGSREKVYQALANGINDLIADLRREAAVDAQDIHAMAVAGNTAMTHFFLGLDISTIPVAPWVPVVRTPGFLTASELGLDINAEAPVFVFPNAGSYVGGDITAGIIATGMHEAAQTSILVDVGTNAEVVIGNREWMIVGAGAAGPALEEGISRVGRRAKRGVVYDVEIRDGRASCRTFDDAAPEGICGSGMISLVYELFQAGVIDQTGTFIGPSCVAGADGERSFALDCAGGDGLTITQTEVRNFLRSKAAMFTLLLTLTRSVGITFRDVRNVFVSGALGTGINVAKAAGIGMVPAWSADIVKPMGNTSLAGCRMLLANGEVAAAADRLSGMITYKHMHDDPEFMKEFRGAVFLPHTDPELLKV